MRGHDRTERQHALRPDAVAAAVRGRRDPLGDPAACPDLCRAWAQSCRGAVSAAKRCTLAIFEEIGSVMSAQCTTGATGAERAQCHRTTRSEIDVLKAEATAQAEMGFSFCADAQQTDDCRATCQATE